MEKVSGFASVCILIILCAKVLFPVTKARHHNSLFVFGDSLYDAGNNNYLPNAGGRANFCPYGETFFKHPTGRFSDGRIIPDFIAEYAKLPLISPYLEPGTEDFTNGVNFASGGAGALDITNPGLVINLKTQLVDFQNVDKQLRQKLGDEETKTLLSRAIFLFSIGSNDYMLPFYTNSTILQAYSPKEYVEMVIGNLTTVVQDIHRIGGRKFAFLNVPALGCTPIMKALKNRTTESGCLKEVTKYAKLHNTALSKAFEQLQVQLQGFKYSVFDLYTSLNERYHNPSKYGFTVGKSGCCGSGPYRGIWTCGMVNGTVKEYQLCHDPSDYLFFDLIHPTEKANRQFAELMWTGSTKVASPYNIKQLLKA